MTFFQLTTFLLLILIQFDSGVSDILDDIQLSQTGDDFWEWMFGNDANETDGHKSEDHIKEELEYHYGSIFSGMDNSILGLKQELDFHLFNLHDFDKNKLLDGLEMLSMLQRHDTPGHHTHQNRHTFEQNTAVIDMVLRTEDKNNDGYLDYNEFKSAKIKHNLKGL